MAPKPSPAPAHVLVCTIHPRQYTLVPIAAFPAWINGCHLKHPETGAPAEVVAVVWDAETHLEDALAARASMTFAYGRCVGEHRQYQLTSAYAQRVFWIAP